MRGRWQAGLVSAILMAASLALPGASSAGSASLTAAPAGTRAMWLWGDQPAAEVVDWAGRQHVSEIFVYVSPSVLTNGDLERMQDMKERAVPLKIKLRALGGDPAWVTDHAAALAWQRTVVATGLFSGIHLDVEPYLTDGWTTDLSATMTSYLKLLDKMRSGSTLPLEADVPFWFGEYPIGANTLADEVLRRVNAVTVMSYRDTGTGPNSMLSISQDWLARGRTAGKRVRLGAETAALADCPHCTFAEEGATKLRTELAKVDAGTRRSAAFAGIAVHRYGTWRALPS
jgi:nucleotide-binding universal stress UspA family protein